MKNSHFFMGYLVSTQEDVIFKLSLEDVGLLMDKGGWSYIFVRCILSIHCPCVSVFQHSHSSFIRAKNPRISQ